MLEAMDASDREWVASAIAPGTSFPAERVTLTTLRMLTTDQFQHLEERIQKTPLPMWGDDTDNEGMES